MFQQDFMSASDYQHPNCRQDYYDPFCEHYVHEGRYTGTTHPQPRIHGNGIHERVGVGVMISQGGRVGEALLGSKHAHSKSSNDNDSCLLAFPCER